MNRNVIKNYFRASKNDWIRLYIEQIKNKLCIYFK